MVTRDSRTAAIANIWPGSRHEPPPALIGFRATTVVRVVKDLRDNIVAYRGREEPGDLESFLDGAMSGIDPALRVALTLALLAGGQSAPKPEHGTYERPSLKCASHQQVEHFQRQRTAPSSMPNSACRCSWMGSAI